MYMKEENGVWTKPKEGYPYVTVDGKYFFFYSNRVSVLNKNRIPDGPGNVCWIDAKFIQELKPKE
jgi:ribosomal protein L24E